MSSFQPDNAAGHGKRRSLFSRSPLSAIYDSSQITSGSSSSSKPGPKQLKKRRTPPVAAPSPSHTPSSSFGDSITGSPRDEPEKSQGRPSLTLKTGSARPSSFFGSLRSFRSVDELEEDLLTATSSNTLFNQWNEGQEASTRYSKQVLCHGEVQTSSSLFRKRKEYLVLTESHIFKLKSYQKASEMFSQISATPPVNHRSSTTRHVSTPSASSMQDFQSVSSDNMEKEYGTPLRQVVAVYHMDDGAPYFTVEVDYLDESDNHAMSFTLRFPDQEERNIWLVTIRAAANAATLADSSPISAFNHQMVARIVEAERDYDPSSFAVYKVVQRANKTGARSSNEDLTKLGSTICFIAIGVHKVHLVPVFRKSHTPLTPQFTTTFAANTPKSQGILTFTGIRFSELDDAFEMMFRMPFQAHKIFHLASLAARDICTRLRQVEERLRPEWETRPYLIQDPTRTRADSMHIEHPPVLDADSFDHTLIAYCVAYNIRADRIRYVINDNTEDNPRFELLAPAGNGPNQYSELELLAILRSLRYNETFGTISFAGIQLDALNDASDDHGTEHVCIKTKRGTSVKMDYDELCGARVLVQELRALAMTSRKLRRMDFTSCILRKPVNSNEGGEVRDQGCGIAEALFPLCKLQVTNVDWLVLNGIHLGETDLDYIGGALVDRSCHFRALELSGCGLTDRSLTLLLDTLRAQDGTMEALDLSRNPARLSPSSFGSQLSVFGFLRRLDLSQLSRTTDPDSLIPYETLMAWRLEELSLSGTSVNAATLDVICRYLLSSRSDLLRDLRLDHSYLKSKDMSLLMRAAARHPGGLPQLHVDLSQNEIEKDRFYIIDAIRENLTPAMLTFRLMEYQDETHFRTLIQALTRNETITHLDISRASLPTEVSEETSLALERLFSDNTTLQYLDISGEDSRLESSKLGAGISKALSALTINTTLLCLKIQCQNLGIRGAHSLADVIKSNKTLQELHCENNSIPLSGFMDIVNALELNTTLQYLSGAEDSRREAQHMAQLQLTALKEEPDKRDSHYNAISSKSMSLKSKFASSVGRTSRGPKQKAADHPNRRSKFMQVEEALDAIDDLDRFWDKQARRLEEFLYRNQSLKSGLQVEIPVTELEEVEPDRPDFARQASGMTIEKILASVDNDATPRAEREVFLADGTIAGIMSASETRDIASTSAEEAQDRPPNFSRPHIRGTSTDSTVASRPPESPAFPADPSLLQDFEAAMRLSGDL